MNLLSNGARTATLVEDVFCQPSLWIEKGAFISAPPPGFHSFAVLKRNIESNGMLLMLFEVWGYCAEQSQQPQLIS